jgi:uncharacterized membrane protein
MPTPEQPDPDEPQVDEPTTEEPQEETPTDGEPNEPPTTGSSEAAINALALNGPSAGFVHFSVTLNAAVVAGDNVSYTWDFGDGATATGATVQHTYDEAGTYTITLTASNSQGNTQVTSQITIKQGLMLPRIAR